VSKIQQMRLVILFGPIPLKVQKKQEETMNRSDSWYRGESVSQSLGENYEKYLVPTPLADLLAQVEEARWVALLADVSVPLQPYLDGKGLVFPIESQIIMAHK
jgi:hypothetical protein